MPNLLRPALLLLVIASSWQLSAPRALSADARAPLTFESQRRVKAKGDEWQIEREPTAWKPEETAVVICDMWDMHHCKNATDRVGEMAPHMNVLVNKLRDSGALVIHCPSGVLYSYPDHPARKLAQAAPKVETKVPLQGWCHLDGGREGQLPIDDSDGGCDTPAEEQAAWRQKLIDMGRNPNAPWKRQIDTIEIKEGDAMTESAEAFYLMKQRGIKNVLVMGVHTNMCVLGRPFSIRQMVNQGQNVVLVRDMTDTMYNPAKRPQVSHFRGTELVVEHIEKHWCPTTTSAEFLGGLPFTFAGDKRPHAVVIIGEDEYETERTLPAFLEAEVAKDVRCSFVLAGPKAPNDFRGVDAPGLLDKADLVVLSARRRTPTTAQLAAIKKYAERGGPIVALRTSSHAFALRNDAPAPEGHGSWPELDQDVLGGNYQGHHGNKGGSDPNTFVKVDPSAKDNPLLAGVPAEEFPVTSWLYKTSPLAKDCTVLMTGRVEGREPAEPVTWTRETDGRRVFYTSLGHPDDFNLPAFRALLKNGVNWALK